MEDYAAFLGTTYGDFEFNSISFQEPKQENGYMILPFQTSIKATRQNFERFLGLVNLSGDLEGRDPIRLMDISQISLRFLGVENKTGKDLGVDFNVTMNAYSRL
jgi:hypothetical protein